MMGSSYKDLFKLYDLIQNGDTRSVEQYLRNNETDLNVILPCKGIGVLHLAVGVEPVEKSRICTELILNYGGDPNLSNFDGVTPVHIAAIWGRTMNLKLLLGSGGDPSLRDIDGLSAFDYAAREQQWDVYDYLHNVVDQRDDSLSDCAYTLDLDKVLVTADQMVAEYGPVKSNDNTHRACRKSEMVRQWCDKTSLVMNKLYPTILSETYLLDDVSPPWTSIDVTNNTLDLTKDRQITNHDKINDTNTTFKTCVTSKVSPDIEISGIKYLDITADENKSNECDNKTNSLHKRISVYENFSLPGSPNSITHINYNTKTSLKKNKTQSKASTSFEDKCLSTNHSHSLLTDDRSSSMDRAQIVVENKTNEWLSTSSSRSSDCQCTEVDVRGTNTRRSSASSGVSSNFSGGSIVIASVEEEYKYVDKKEDVVLIEKRLLVSPVVLPVDDNYNITNTDQSIISIASSLPQSVEYDNNTLRAELIALGYTPGPIHNSTRSLYLKKLHALKKNPIIVTNSKGKAYSIELEKSLRNSQWMSDLYPYMELESKARTSFTDPKVVWREGSAKTSFTYLLLDPRMTNNLPAKAGKQSQHESWVTFVNSIFYVGKGKRSRPYAHLYQALTIWKSNVTTTKDMKVQKILDIWSDKVGVICLLIFQNVIPAEAYTYEAAMIDVLGLQNLTNLKSGTYSGPVQHWPLKERRMLGLYLLYKAMLTFFNEGERQLRPDDID